MKWVLGLLAVFLPAGAAGATRPLEPVPFPDTGAMEPAVAQQLDELRRKVVTSPSADAFGACGSVYLVYDLAEPAAACLRNARLLAPTEPRWPYFLGRLHARRGELATAREAFAAATSLAPAEPAPWLRLGEAALAEGDLGAARDAFGAARRLRGAQAAADYGLGREALEAGDAAAAVARLRGALELAPYAGAVRYALAMALRRMGRVEEARGLLAVGDNRQPPSYPEPWTQEMLALDRGVRGKIERGTELLAAGRFAEAIAELEAAVLAQPDHAKAWQNLGAARGRLGDVAGARAAYERAIELDPSAAVPQGNLGVLLLGVGETDLGIQWLERALALAPESPSIQFNLAVALLERGRGDRALNLLESVLRRAPEDVAARHYHAVALIAAGRLADALVELRQVIATSPQVASPRLAEARALLLMGEETTARRRLEDAHLALPQEEGVTLELIEVLSTAESAEARDGARAWSLAEELLRGGPTQARAEAAAMALAELGRFAGAVEKQRQAIDLAGADPTGSERMKRRLRLYEAGSPLRQPWREAPAASRRIPP